MSDENLSSSANEDASNSIVRYGIEDKPPLAEAVPLGLQHVLAMFLSNTALPVIVALAIGLSAGDAAFLVQMALVVGGIATIVQAYPIGPVGARLPIVMGTSFAFLAPMIAIGNRWGLAAIFGAVIVAAPVEILIGRYITTLRRFFPPLVTGTVVMLIGLSLIPAGMDYAAGGPGAESYGELVNLGLAATVLALAVGLNQFFDGFLSVASILVAIVVGYVLAAPLGLLDLSGVADAGWFAVPMPLAYGLEFHVGAIVTIAFVYIIGAIETIGDISGTTEATGREPTADELRGGLIADGAMSAFAAVFNAFPNTSFSQNVGLISFTGVASRYVVAIGGVVLLVLGFVPKVGSVVAAMPAPVLGGGALVMFGMIFAAGARIVSRGAELNQRNMTILAVAFALGLGVEVRPDALAALPADAQVFFGSGLIAGGLTAVILNATLPETTTPHRDVADDPLSEPSDD